MASPAHAFKVLFGMELDVAGIADRGVLGGGENHEKEPEFEFGRPGRVLAGSWA